MGILVQEYVTYFYGVEIVLAFSALLRKFYFFFFIVPRPPDPKPSYAVGGLGVF